MQLNDVVLSVINDFVSNSALFTALDVSNKVKETLPFARHRDVRDLVRDLFVSHVEPQNYARTPIKVSLDNGDVVEALLYHPLADSWDLDTKYDDQKRKQTALKPAANVVAPVLVPKQTAAQAASLSASVVGSLPAASTSVLPASANAQWHQLFSSTPSLFPTK